MGALLAPALRQRGRGDQSRGAVTSEDLAERLAQRRGLAGEHVPGGLDEGHFAAQAAHGPGHFGADRPAAEYDQAAGMAFMAVTSRLVHTPCSPRRPGIGGTTGSEPVATTT